MKSYIAFKIWVFHSQLLLCNNFANIMLMKNNLNVWFFVLVSSEKSITKQNIYHKPFHKIEVSIWNTDTNECKYLEFRFTCLVLFPKQLLSGLVFTFGNISERCRCILHFHLYISKNTHWLDDRCILLTAHGHYKSIDDFTEFSKRILPTRQTSSSNTMRTLLILAVVIVAGIILI